MNVAVRTITLAIHTVNVKFYFEWSKYFVKPISEIIICIDVFHIITILNFIYYV